METNYEALVEKFTTKISAILDGTNKENEEKGGIDTLEEASVKISEIGIKIMDLVNTTTNEIIDSLEFNNSSDIISIFQELQQRVYLYKKKFLERTSDDITAKYKQKLSDAVVSFLKYILDNYMKICKAMEATTAVSRIYSAFSISDNLDNTVNEVIQDSINSCDKCISNMITLCIDYELYVCMSPEDIKIIDDVKKLRKKEKED